MERNGIILAGTVILDIVNVVDHWPEEEKVALIQLTQPGAGGPPHNAGAGLVKLGAPFTVNLIGAAGDDAYGDTLIEQAKGFGLDTSSIVRVSGAVTSHTIVMSSAKTGKRTFFHQPGINADLTPQMLAAPATSSAKIYYLGSPGIAGSLDSNDGWRDCLRAAKDSGHQTAFELVSMPPEVLVRLTAHLLPLIDIFVVNDHEAEAMSGQRVTRGERLDVDAAISACQKLLDMGVGVVAGIHHPDGAVAVTRSGEMARSGSLNIQPSEIVGSLGAGDAFYSGFLYGWHENWSLKRCLELGNAAAATSLFSVTTSASIRTSQECIKFAQERGCRSL